MAKSVADIVEAAKESKLGKIVTGIVIGGPLATIGYALSYGVRSIQELITGTIGALETVTVGNIQALFGSFPTILNAGAEGTASSLASWGILAWLVSVVIIFATLWMVSKAYDRLNIETLSGLDIPVIDRFQGSAAEDEEA
ncbi:hypothetical protein [Halobaculum sp. P14]|uniref:hypothetical protein n=1 Tax=Halobaculum sp. P14 TaxID=3421638 RepID=UPI003EB69BF2